MAVFDAPPVPGCWQGGEVIRIVDPLGLQVAWVSPALAGGIVGYYARESASDGWTEVLACSTVTGREAGSTLLLRDERSGQMMPVRNTNASWTFATRDPTQTSVSGWIEEVELSVSLQCADGELHIELSPGHGQPGLPEIGLRLHVGNAAGELVATASHGGELAFRGGALRHLSLVHSPGLECRVVATAGGERQVDLVPASISPMGKLASPVTITLIPQPAHRTTST